MGDPNDLSLPELYRTLSETGLTRRLLELARDEDLGSPTRDITSMVCPESDATVTARLVAREAGVASGLAALPELFDVFALNASVEVHVPDGDVFEAKDTIATIAAPRGPLLAVERTMLNLVSRLSGIATLTSFYIEAIEPLETRILDTRKTTPGLRVFEKYAVRCGGGHCHRMGLHDGVLVKDNHIAGVPLEDLTNFVNELGVSARSLDPKPQFVEIEVDSLAQLDRVLATSEGMVDIVLLDNFSIDQLTDAVARRDANAPNVRLEASGGVSLKTIREIAATGVDRVSIGALTHHAVSLDLGLDIG